MDQPVIALKVDVDTWTGTRTGVPRLLDILDSFGIRATFYFSMGPDNSGKAIRRIFTRKGFLKKMLRTRAPSMYGLKTILSGTILPAPMIAASFPHIMRRVEEMGHETGIHCWDHVEWHDHLPRMEEKEVADLFRLSGRSFGEIFGHPAMTTAAPGWTISPASLAVQDSMSLSCCSDSRGSAPFYPVMEGRRYSTLQIPTTWPTMDEILGENGISIDNVNEHYISLLGTGLNVHTIHAELEGMGLSHTFIELLDRLKERNARFVTMGEAARHFSTGAPAHRIYMGEIPGRAGEVAIQGEAV
jgi:peptidoglycan/xylan/chitin deacetylase (PgdA/CDA1 family)